MTRPGPSGGLPAGTGRPAVRGAAGPVRQPEQHARLRAGPYWAGVVATAVVSGLIGLLGALVAKNLLDLNLRLPSWLAGDSDTWRLAILGAGSAIIAGILLELLFVATPTPSRFFVWIILLLTAAAAITPFSLGGTLGEQVATAVVLVLIGLSLMTLLPGVAARTTRPSVAGPWPGGGPNPVTDLR